MFKTYCLAGALVTGLAFCVAPANAQDTDVKVVMSTYGFAFLPVLVADAMGYFEEEGLNVELTKVGGDSKSMAALVGGGADFSATSVSTILRAHANGTGAIAIGALLTQYASNFVISGDWAEEHGITADSTYGERLESLRGSTIGITAPGSGTDHLVRYLANAAGLDPERDLTITALGDGQTMTAALAQGRIDGFTVSSPTSDNAVKEHGAVMLFNFAKGEVEDLDGFFYITSGTRSDYAEENPETVTSFLSAQQSALDAIQDPELTEKARDAVWEKYHSQIEKDFYNEVWENTRPAYPESAVITEDMIERIVSFVNEFDDDKLDPEAVATGWTAEYAKQATDSTN